MVLLAVAIVLSAFAAVFFPFKVRVRVFAKEGVAWRAWLKPPLVPWRIPLPSSRVRKVSGGPGGAGRGTTSIDNRGRRAGDRREMPASPLVRRVQGAASEFRRVYPALRAAAAEILPRIRVTELRVHAVAGAGDACETALLCGTLSAAFGLLVSAAERRGVRFLTKPSGRFVPVFDSARFEFRAEIEASFYVFDVMKTALRLSSHLRGATRGDRSHAGPTLFQARRGILGHAETTERG